jgi:hypothetical protein
LGSASIVGGKSVPITEAPWQLKMNADGSGCGAAWIGGRWALTAAHCVEDATASATYVWAGITRDRDMNNSNRVQAKRIIMYAADWVNPWRDIALLELNADITAPLARPIRWSTPADVTAGYESVGKECLASGWGALNSDYDWPDSLQAVYSKVKRLEPYVIHWAAQGGSQEIGSCQGDSGGPLAVKDGNGDWILAGISSFITSYCGDPDSESSYSRVSGFASWISQQTGGLTALGHPGFAAESWISFPGSGFTLARPGVIDVSIFDAAGALLYRRQAAHARGTHRFPSAGIPAGRYILSIRDKNSRAYSGFLLIP